MKRFFEEIADEIDSGEYFRNARDWYFQKYIFPVVERSYYLFIMGISLTAGYFALVVVADFFPLRQKVPVALPISDTAYQYSSLTRIGTLAEIEKEPDRAVRKFLVQRFVRTFEAYDFANEFSLLKKNLPFISRYATKDIQNQYRKRIDVRNPDSLILKFRTFVRRIVDVRPRTLRVQSIGKAENGDTLYRATVIFVTYDISDEESAGKKWRAVIDFTYRDVTFNKKLKEFDPLQFKVTNYQTTEIE